MITDETKARAWEDLEEFMEDVIKKTYDPNMRRRTLDIKSLMSETLLARLEGKKIGYNGR